MPRTGKVSCSMPYFIGDEPSSSNYRPSYCNKCDADSEEDCICRTNNSGFNYIYQQGNKCRECNQDHSYHPDFSEVQTSIDIIPELQETQSEENSNNSLLGKARKRGVSKQ
jgi:hypothetical protein